MESLKFKCGICGKGHLTIRCYKIPDWKQAYSAEVASGGRGSKEITLITAVRISKERRLGLKKANPVDAVVIHVVAVEVFFVVVGRPTVHHVVADIK